MVRFDRWAAGIEKCLSEEIEGTGDQGVGTSRVAAEIRCLVALLIRNKGFGIRIDKSRQPTADSQQQPLRGSNKQLRCSDWFIG
jgi:hypothetical protein